LPNALDLPVQRFDVVGDYALAAVPERLRQTSLKQCAAWLFCGRAGGRGRCDSIAQRSHPPLHTMPLTPMPLT
jgi:hypothetical protein